VFSPIGVTAFSVFVIGNGALEVQLIAGKLATQSGYTCSIVTKSDDAFNRNCRNLMYGRPSKDEDEEALPEGPFLVSEGDEIGSALEAANGIIIVSEDQALEKNKIDTILSSASENLRHVCFLSQMGRGFSSTEEYLKSKCDSMPGGPVALSIVRAGILKGGGPGKIEGKEFGLHKFFYDNNADLPGVMNIMASDQFTLGAKVSKGDPFSKPNIFQKFKSNSSFEPANAETGRIAAAQALLIALQRETGIDISLSTEKSLEPPTPEEWEQLLAGQ